MSAELSRAFGAHVLFAMLVFSAGLALGCATPAVPSRAPKAGPAPADLSVPDDRWGSRERSSLEEALRELRALSEKTVREDLEIGHAARAGDREGDIAERAREPVTRGITIVDEKRSKLRAR